MIASEILTGPDRSSVSQLARRQGVHVATVWRWILTGCRGQKLHSIRIGGRRFITDADWLAFSAALNADLGNAPAIPTPTAVTNRAEHAGRELDSLMGRTRKQCSPAPRHDSEKS